MALEYTSEFKRSLRKLIRRYRSLRSDLQPLLETLETGETPGDQIQHVHYRVYKVRVRNSDAQRGKSGGYRVIYYLKTADTTILVTIYSKSDQADISADAVTRIIDRHKLTN